MLFKYYSIVNIVENSSEASNKMGRDMDMTSLKRSLIKLNIDVSNVKKCPNYSVIKKAYRKLLVNHPDKGGNTKVFQTITQGFREVLDYMIKNPDNVEGPDEESDEDTKTRKLFEDSREVKYSDINSKGEGNVIFAINQGEEEMWFKSLDAYFNNLNVARVPHKSGGGQQYVDKSWEVPGKEGSSGSLSVTVWATSQDPKVMVQGKHYMTFVALVLPKIALSLGKEETKIKEIMEEKRLEEDDNIKMTTEKEKDEIEPTKESVPEAKEKPKQSQGKNVEKELLDNKEVSPKETPVSIPETGEINSTVERLQKGVEERLENMTKQLEISIKLQQIAETKIEELTKNITILNNDVKEVNVKVGNVEKFVSDTSKEVKEMAAVFPAVLKMEEDFKKQKESVNKILEVALKMEVKLNDLKNKYSTKEPKDKEEEDKTEIIEVAQKKGIMFSSSVAMPLRLDEIEKATDSTIKKVKTFRVIENKSAIDPDLHLNNVMNKHLDKVKKEEDFGILSVGSNDIDDAVKQEDKVAAVENVAENIIAFADLMSRDMDMDVFINEMIPRHDDEEKADFSNLANSFLHTKLLNLQDKRLHIVRHSNLLRPEGKDRDLLYRNGKHLSNFGLKQYSNNIIKTMSKVYTTKEVPPKPPVKLATKPKVPDTIPDNPLLATKVQTKESQQRPKWIPKWTPLPREPPGPLHREPPQQQRYQGQNGHQNQQLQYQQPQFQAPQYQAPQYQAPQYQPPQYQPPPPHQTGYWCPPSSPPPCPSPVPPPPTQYHWTQGPQGQYSQGGHYHYTQNGSHN